MTIEIVVPPHHKDGAKLMCPRTPQVAPGGLSICRGRSSAARTVCPPWASLPWASLRAESRRAD